MTEPAAPPMDAETIRKLAERIERIVESARAATAPNSCGACQDALVEIEAIALGEKKA